MNVGCGVRDQIVDFALAMGLILTWRSERLCSPYRTIVRFLPSPGQPSASGEFDPGPFPTSPMHC